jgi:hypothetical protein
MARSHLIRAALMLLLLAAAAPALASQNSPLSSSSSSSSPLSSAAKNGNGNGKGNNDKHCPDARACRLATQAALDGDVSLLFGFFGEPLYGLTQAFLSLADPTKCEDVSADPGFETSCFGRPGDAFPSMVLRSTCPEAYWTASQSACEAFIMDADGVTLQSALPIFAAGDDGAVSFCYASAPFQTLDPPPPDGARVFIQLTQTCTEDASLLAAGGGGGRFEKGQAKKRLAAIAAKAGAARGGGRAKRVLSAPAAQKTPAQKAPAQKMLAQKMPTQKAPVQKARAGV